MKAADTTVSGNSLDGMREKILRKLPSLRGRKLIVVGDLGLDQYVHGEVRRISPEGPVPVLEVVSEDQRLGLATNVAQNIASLGGVPLLVGVVGRDQACEDLKGLLTSARVSTDYLVVDPHRPTTRKLRVMSGHHHLVRVDYEHRRYLDLERENQLLSIVGDLLGQADGVVLEDYAKGVVSERCAQELTKICRGAGKPLMVDPNRQTPSNFYRGATLMTPNRDEAYGLSGLQVDDLQDTPDLLFKVGETLVKNLGLEHLVITEGKQGMSLFTEGRVFQFPTFARQVFDVTGAGDTVIAALGLAWVSGFSLPEACVLGNYAAGVVVGKIGCVPCHTEELVEYINQLS
ncbi:MAG: D-glycero-beta-D-manno-heptose-7-phosphate kinase [Bdellovibrionales bacterium]|nr:D-glycero-beta-D-manno-heptose-7-phosphate kinase [Bdellovibrionales bacterium]